MSKKLYVGNLPFSVTDDVLTDAFAEYGQVDSARVIMDQFSGRSKGFGFVEMSSDSEASEAVEKLNGADLGGRAIVVNEARPMAPRGEGRGDRGGDRGGGRGGNRGGRY
ncbi:MAG: RNA-binding protein [Deltaproteobacteria bacterium]|nr:RNA-binding protein [Deltaproteobacteria bacterium]